MHGEVHANHVLYKKGAEPPTYRQIAVVEWSEQFEVRIFGGTVVQLNPKFIAETSDAEVHLRTTLKEALQDADDEAQQSVSSGAWFQRPPIRTEREWCGRPAKDGRYFPGT